MTDVKDREALIAKAREGLHKIFKERVNDKVNTATNIMMDISEASFFAGFEFAWEILRREEPKCSTAQESETTCT